MNVNVNVNVILVQAALIFRFIRRLALSPGQRCNPMATGVGVSKRPCSGSAFPSASREEASLIWL